MNTGRNTSEQTMFHCRGCLPLLLLLLLLLLPHIQRSSPKGPFRGLLRHPSGGVNPATLLITCAWSPSLMNSRAGPVLQVVSKRPFLYTRPLDDPDKTSHIENSNESRYIRFLVVDLRDLYTTLIRPLYGPDRSADSNLYVTKRSD